MWHEVRLRGEFFAGLLAIDGEMARRVQAGGCARCGGPLCVGHYERKPRGGAIATAGELEVFTERYSFCCSRCRRRATPPSVRFLGRKVYVEGAILIACALLPLIEQSARAVREATGVALRTLRRWQTWWQTVFVGSALWVEARARVPALAEQPLPGALIESFEGDTPTEKLVAAMKFLVPLTTSSVDGSRFVRDAM